MNTQIKPLFFALITCSNAIAQDYPSSNKQSHQDSFQEEKKEAPAFMLLRAEENYDYLKPKDSPYEKDYLDKIKLIPLNKSKSVNVTLGGEFRLRIEHFENQEWEDFDETFYSQRLSLHSNINITKYFRFFGELYHGLLSKEEEEFAQSDLLGVHQGFLEFKLPKPKSLFSVRLGRQELSYGSGRLVGMREGPNIRRSFDAARFTYSQKKFRAEVFIGNEVIPAFGVFDNKISLLDDSLNAPLFWGAYTRFHVKKDIGATEAYYFGINTQTSFFNDAIGEDQRHTLGIRRFGKINKKMRYNTELMFQSGQTDGKSALAWAIDASWSYMFIDTKLKPELGIKIDVLSGDRNFGDDKIQTFNAMFTNPGYYSLAGIIAPSNLIEFHPSLSITPIKKMKIYAEWAVFIRYSLNDGVYSPPRFLNRAGHLSSERLIGNQLGVKLDYEIDRHLLFDIDFSYFMTGEFIQATGPSSNLIHAAASVSYKF